MHTIQIDDQVFAVLQRAAALLVEPSPNGVLRRILLADPVLARLPDAPWPSEGLGESAGKTGSAASSDDANGSGGAVPRPLPLGTIPPPRSERSAKPGRVPAWAPLSDVVGAASPRPATAPHPARPATVPRAASVAASASDLPPGLRQAFDVIYLIVRHRVPRPEALRRVSDLRRAAGTPTGGPRLAVGARDFDRMVWQRGYGDLRKLLKSTFPDSRQAIDEFLDELSGPKRSQGA